MHRIFIKNLKLYCIIGIDPGERRRKQQVLVNVAVWSDLSRATRGDNIADTVDYRALTQKIIRFVEASKFNLLETLAERLADLCLQDKVVKGVEIRVEKPGALRFAESAGVEVTKEKGH